jgi:hypothetical protein
MYSGVLILEFTGSEVLTPSRRSGRLAAIAPEDGAPTGGFCNDWVKSACELWPRNFTTPFDDFPEPPSASPVTYDLFARFPCSYASGDES